jgi:hypothetical protein
MSDAREEFIEQNSVKNVNNTYTGNSYEMCRTVLQVGQQTIGNHWAPPSLAAFLSYGRSPFHVSSPTHPPLSIPTGSLRACRPLRRDPTDMGCFVTGPHALVADEGSDCERGKNIAVAPSSPWHTLCRPVLRHRGLPATGVFLRPYGMSVARGATGQARRMS